MSNIEALQKITIVLSFILISLLFGVWYFQQQTVQPTVLFQSYKQVFAEKEQGLASLNQALFTEIVDKSLSFEHYKTLEKNALSIMTATENLTIELKKFVQQKNDTTESLIELYRAKFKDFQQEQLALVDDYRAKKKLEKQLSIKSFGEQPWHALPKENDAAAALLLAYQARITENALLNYYNGRIGLTNHNPTLCSWVEPVVSAVKNEVNRGEYYQADIVLGAWCRVPKQHNVMVNRKEIKPENGHYYFIQMPQSIGKYAVNVEIGTNVMNEETPQFFKKTFEYEVVK